MSAASQPTLCPAPPSLRQSARRLDLPPPKRLSPAADSLPGKREAKEGRAAMNQLTADTAVTSARAALWTWNAQAASISVRAEPGGPLASLDGQWTLDTFLAQIEGLGRGMVATRLREG